ncbi:MAG: hypothetical protein UR69_C0002G0300 [Candidatus Moranbacteria bacterium GW2011_GWE2_35_2-]|nr:MAG: hypothetical protein UR69_C0002G0300 [Candidatus Moranbacteria bacterium GW2011_GWE2_35_2-]KKQ06540.1 MAG: hypothetical protein US15_C0009G0014 [Candidatus Moranbacteria bacterium GW2011_GWF1_36_4]KKQ21900.1 MAG: hypothetical protein US37_C0006G0028 [Candidatus Moranbacteria bacterium GW2011_GWF2_37_11]KKQ29421.1 MAG: hypothetical protein US44_C0001G0013 [Candidatus Moranbacteria bacterium GW2011_GWD1_37_17]KKQ30710.1 MAG: hypothetical protein US47_C0002G0300 [Candidatus Moranbacteria b
MSQMERKMLEDFLKKSGFDNADGAMEALELYYQIMMRGRFKLAPKERIDEELLRKAIQVVTKDRVEGILLIPMNKFFIIRGGVVSFDAYLKGNFSYIWKEESKNDGTLTLLSERFWDGIGRDIAKVFFDNIDDTFSYKYGVSVRNALNKNFFYFLWFFLKKDVEQTKRLEATLKFWGKCFIVGKKKGSGVWLVATKSIKEDVLAK